jgi:hypothetical protein
VDRHDNPASRLHFLLTLMQDCNDVDPDTSGSFHRRLAQVLSVDPGNALEYARPFLQVLHLPDEAQAEVLRLNDESYDPELILMWHPPVREALNAAIFRTNDLGHFQGQLTEPSMLSLRFCGDLLHRRLAQRMLTQEELDRVGDLIDELEQEITLDTNIDRDVRAFLLGHVKLMKQALADVPLFGSGRLEDALDQVVGSLHRRSDIVARSDKNPSTWAKLGNLIVVIAAVFQIAGVQLALPSVIKHELTSGHAPTAQVKVVPMPSGSGPAGP